MKCPACHYVCSDLRDICPKCLLDLRPSKNELGLPISFPDASYAMLVRKQIPSQKGERRGIAPITEVAKKIGRLFGGRSPKKTNTKQGVQEEPDSERQSTAEATISPQSETVQQTPADSTSTTDAQAKQGFEVEGAKVSQESSHLSPGLEYRLKNTSHAAPEVVELDEATLEASLSALEQSEMEVEAVRSPKKEVAEFEFEFEFEDEAFASPSALSEALDVTQAPPSSDQALAHYETQRPFTIAGWLIGAEEILIAPRFGAVSSQPNIRSLPPLPRFAMRPWLTRTSSSPVIPPAETPTFPSTPPLKSRESPARRDSPPSEATNKPKASQGNVLSHSVDELFQTLVEKLPVSNSDDFVVELSSSAFLSEADKGKIELLFEQSMERLRAGITTRRLDELSSTSRVVALESSSLDQGDIEYVSNKKAATLAPSESSEGEILFPASASRQIAAHCIDVFLMFIFLAAAVLLIVSIAAQGITEYESRILQWYLSASLTFVGLLIVPPTYYFITLLAYDGTPGMRFMNLSLRHVDESEATSWQRAQRALCWPLSLLTLSPLWTLLTSRSLLDRIFGQQTFLRVRFDEGQ